MMPAADSGGPRVPLSSLLRAHAISVGGLEPALVGTDVPLAPERLWDGTRSLRRWKRPSGDGVRHDVAVSWDVYCFVVPDDVDKVSDIPPGYAPPAIASASEVLDALRQRCATVDASDQTWVVVDDRQLFAEVSVKGESPNGIMFFVRGGSSPGPLIAQVAADLGCRALDCNSGDWLDGGDGSFAAWKSFRDRVVGDA